MSRKADESRIQMMRKVFLCEYIHPEAYAYLKAHAEVIHDWDRLSEAEALINRNLKIDGVINSLSSGRRPWTG